MKNSISIRFLNIFAITFIGLWVIAFSSAPASAQNIRDYFFPGTTRVAPLQGGGVPVNYRSGRLRVLGLAQPFVDTGKNVKESFLSQPRPDIWLEAVDGVDRVGKGTAIRFPDKVYALTDVYWKALLASRYCTGIDPPKDADTYKQCVSQVSQQSDLTRKELQKVRFNLRGEIRTISHEQTEGIINFLISRADKIEKEAAQKIDRP